MSKERRLKRVAFVIGNMTGGGAERVVSVLSNEFVRRGIDVCIHCIGREEAAVDYKLDARVRIMQIPSRSKNALLGKLDQWKRLRKSIKAFAPDAVVAFMSYIAVQTLLALSFSSVPVVYSIRAYVQDEIRSRTLKILTGLLYRRARGAVYQTKDQQDYFKPSARRKEVVLLNPVAENTLWHQEKILSEPVIISVGRLRNSQKDFPLLIRAFAQIASNFPEYMLEILGEGPDRVQIESLIEKCGLNGRVRLPGFVSDVSNRVFTSVIFVFPSNAEGLPNALIEAMCLGVPCITTDFDGGGVCMLMKPGENGLVVPKGDVNALANAIQTLLKNPQKARELGLQACNLRERVRSDSVVDQWISFLEGIVS